MMMNKQKFEKKSFKGRIFKILSFVLIVFMIFGAMRSCVKVKADTIYFVGSYYDSTSTDYFYFNASGFVNTQYSIVYLPIQASITTYSNGSQFSTFTYNSTDNRYQDFNEYIFLESATGVDSISVNSVELFPFTFTSWDSFDTMIEEHLFTYTYLDTIQMCFKMSFDCEFYAYIYSYTDGDDYPIDSDEPDEPIPEPSPDTGISSLDVNNYYYFDTDLTEFVRSLGLTNGSYATISTSNNIVFGQYLDIAFTSIRFGRFFPEASFSEFYLELYNSNNSTSIRLWSCVYDYSGTEPVLSYSHWYVNNATLYILNNQVTYTTITQSGFYSILNHGTYSEYSTIYNNAWQSGYNAGVLANNNITYSAGYNEGYNDGIVHGLSDTSNPLIDEAYDSGFQEGKSLGRQEALLEDNDYTFRGLMFAVLQAPITVFSGLFNWNFLGYNLKDFFFTCLTMACIIAIVRRFI